MEKFHQSEIPPLGKQTFASIVLKMKILGTSILILLPPLNLDNLFIYKLKWSDGIQHRNNSMQFKLLNITFSNVYSVKNFLWENLLLFNVSEKPTKTMLKNIDFDYVIVSISHLHQIILSFTKLCYHH